MAQSPANNFLTILLSLNVMLLHPKSTSVLEAMDDSTDATLFSSSPTKSVEDFRQTRLSISNAFPATDLGVSAREPDYIT